MADPDQPKFAHFEGVKETSVYHLYGRHDEVARQIHQDTLRRFTGNDELTVDLVSESPIVPETMDTLDHLQEYDVVSVSSGVGLGSILSSGGIAGGELTAEYRQRFIEEDMPIYVVSAGNEGLSKQVAMPRVADLARNSLVVGEANAGEGSPFVEEHSSRNNPTLTSDSPFNRGEKYQYYDTSPSLEGHEDLVREWVINKQIQNGIDLFLEHNKDKGLDQDVLDQGARNIYRALSEKYRVNENDIAWIDGQVQAYMEDPEALHSQIMAEFREKNDIDENGYVTGLDGTSFSGPEQAGYVSGAMYEQWQREEQNLPILTKDEITTLAKMATVDTTAREGEADPMHSFTNDDGHEFVAGGGHGVFNPEMFRALLDESYRRIGSDPDIDRESVTNVMSAEIGEGHTGNMPVTLESNLPEGQTMIIDRIRFDAEYGVDGGVPHFAVLQKPGEEDPSIFRMQQASSRGVFSSGARLEYNFGETLNGGEDWTVSLNNGGDATMHDMQITVHGYNEGGLMDQMMDYSKELAADLEVQPNEPAPTADVVTPDAVAPEVVGGDTNPTLPKGP